MVLQHFTLHLDDEDPEDVMLIRYLNRFKRKRKVSHELRNAMFAYLVSLKKGAGLIAFPTSSGYVDFGNVNSVVQAPAVPQALPNGTQASTTKAIKEARRTFLNHG